MNTRQGIWIPQEIIEDDKLDWINKVFLSEIISLSKLEKGCFASNETFGRLLNLHKGNISKRISFLIAEDYIKIELIKAGEKKTLRIITPHKAVSGHAPSSKRQRTEEYAYTHRGVSGYAPSSKRERSPIISSTNSFTKSDTNSITNTVTNTEFSVEEALDKYIKNKNIK